MAKTRQIWRKEGGLEAMLARPAFYTVAVFILARAHSAAKYEGYLCELLGWQTGFPFLRVLVYALCGCVYFLYGWRYFTDRLPAPRPMLIAVGALFAALWLSTVIHRGDTGYHIDWHAGFALMLMLDMGLQRERESTLNAFSLALLLWVLLNLLSIALYPYGYEGPNDSPLYAPEWLLGTRVYYYRIAFAALGFEIVRTQVCRGRWSLRTLLVLAAVLATTALERGGTGIIGLVFFLGLLLLFNRRALPRWATPAAAAALSILLLIGLALLRVQDRFDWLIGMLGKDATLSGRTEAWAAALPLIRQHWLSGVGLRPLTYANEVLGYSHTHNQLLELLLHGGVMALIPYVAMIALATHTALRWRRYAAVKTAALLLMTYLLMGTVEIFHTDPIYYPLFILLSRADCLCKGAQKLPCLSLCGRIRQDIADRRS